MTDVTAIEPHTPAPTLLPSEQEAQRIYKLAQSIANTDFVPRSLRGNPHAIMAAMLTGRELGIMPMRALRQVNMVEGTPSPSPELMMALALKAGHEVDVVETSRTRCVVEVRRAGWAEDRVRRLEWTLEDAEAAGLCTVVDGKVKARSKQGKPLPWEAYTRAMLRSRAVSEACRTWLPDVVDGASYIPEELGSTVNADGHAVELVDAAEHAGQTYDPLEGESDEVRQAVAEAMTPTDDEDDDDGEVVDAELVDDDEPGEITGDVEPEPEPEPPAGVPDADDTADDPEVVEFDWKDHAEQAGVSTVQLLKTLREDWPRNDMARQPNRSKDIDTLAADPAMSDMVRATIDDLTGGR